MYSTTLLPDDILSSILILCQGSPLTTNALWDPNQPPLIFGHVCSRWRTLSLSTALLWSNILVTRPSPTQLARLVEWLKRSKECPIGITLDDRSTAQSESSNGSHDHTAIGLEAWNQRWTEVINLVVPHSPRWVRLRCNISPRDTDYMMSLLSTHKSKSGSLALEILKQVHMDYVCGRRNRYPTLDFSGSRELEEMVVSGPASVRLVKFWKGVGIGNGSNLQGQQHNNLRVLRCGFSGTLYELASYLRLLPNLRECALYANLIPLPRTPQQHAYTDLVPPPPTPPSVSRTPPPSEPIHLPHLQTLSIQSSPLIYSALGFLTLPSLIDLKLTTQLPSSSPHDPFDFISDLLNRSKCSLRSLATRSCRTIFLPEVLEECLALSPSMKKLTVGFMPLYPGRINTVLALLSAVNPNSELVLLPELREIQITAANAGAEVWTSISRFVLKRWGGPSGENPEGKLRVIRFFDPWSVEKAFEMPVLRACVREGLEIRH